MGTVEELADGFCASTAAIDAQPFALRSYQAEMVEESLRSNIIVVMDTGSGKTHIGAVERTRAELEICDPHKRVWFLAPTVTLCEQQSKVFSQYLPGYNVLMLSGRDNVEHWTEQSVWDVILHNVRVVLSTHQVLYDALSHGFVKMDGLSLLIFDEAHHCTRNHVANQIMSNFYIPRVKAGNAALPAILGLSASPVMRAQATTESLKPRQIEHNMHATARSPKKSRSELLQYVHLPELIRVEYKVGDVRAHQSPLLAALYCSYSEYDIMSDPYTKDLLRKQQAGIDVSKELQQLFTSHKTYCMDQLKALANKTQDLVQELGLLTGEWYLHQCVEKFEKSVFDGQQLLDRSCDEKQHLLTILRQLPFEGFAPCPPLNVNGLSRKVEALIDVLINEARDKSDFIGLVFVEQRIWVAVLAEILTVHPRTRNLFRVGTFLGSSSSTVRKTMIAAFPEPKNQRTILEDFREGTTNLILATSVLEEGIDIASCHLVICFERPKNLKSFIQRRGRARMQKSKYLVFMPQVGGGHSPETWEVFEQEMKKAYLDDMRQSNLAIEMEAEEEEGSRCFEIERTGARLTLNNALPHLNHFCALLGSGPYVDPRPQFGFEWSEADSSVTAEVTLPILVDRAVRKACSLRAWRTEKMARKDVAFEAYKALYAAGLVNDHLLPVRQETHDLAEFQLPENRPSMMPASPTLDPWASVVRKQQQKPRSYFRTVVQILRTDNDLLCFNVFTILPLPPMGPINLYWNEHLTYTATMLSPVPITLAATELITLQSITYKILQSVHSARMHEEKQDFLWLLAPCDSAAESLDFTKLEKWNNTVNGCQSALKCVAISQDRAEWGLIQQHGDNRKYLLQASTTCTQTADVYLHAVRLPKRRDFLHRVNRTSNMNDAYTRREDLRASECLVENLPASLSIIALLMPSLMHRTEVTMIADTLRTTLLSPVDIHAKDLPLLVRAITASSVSNESNYQRLEFLGDCILKFIASLHVMAENPRWPENYLTGKKGKIVSNGFLARATLTAGLDQFIITKHFTGARWSPRYLKDLSAATEPSARPERSSKLLADVIESLIGVSYVVGGFPKAFACVQTLLPLEEWMSIPDANTILHQIAPTDIMFTSFGLLESLIGHEFIKKTLLFEALTHSSYTGPNAHSSYERLEFLGDAVLDCIVSRRLYAHDPPLSHQTMHAMRTAMVNAAFLAFRMLETTVPEETNNKTTLQAEVRQRALWQFMRSGSIQLTASRDVALEQHKTVREQLNHALQTDDEFPWHVLALLNPPKALSDIVESVIGAIYVDTQGDISACEVFVRHLGILECLERILRDNVDCLHPKERLGHLAVERSVQYAPIHDKPRSPQASADKMWRCQVNVGGEDVGGIVEGLTRLTAETIAAWRANEILRSKVPAIADTVGKKKSFPKPTM